MAHANVKKTRQRAWAALFFCLVITSLAAIASYFLADAWAEVTISENDQHSFTASAFLGTDVIFMENTVDLDTKKRDDRVVYLGATYNFEFDLKLKNEGPEFFLKLERAGPYDYSTPLIVRNTLMTSVGKVAPYTGAELLPKISEWYVDLPLAGLPVRFKSGLFNYSVGHDISLCGYFNNYSLMLYTESEDISWRFYYCWPDLSSKNMLGPYIEQEKEQGISYDRSVAYFFATDATITIQDHTLQPYIGMLVDNTGGKRENYFATPTRQDMLGTVGLAWYYTLDKLSVSLEAAKNFGAAASDDPDHKDVEHRGYMVYADADYDLGLVKPHSRFIYASGNKVTEDMVANGDELYDRSRNDGFSVASPLNVNLLDSIYSGSETLPLVALGIGWGLNYGIQRPSSFWDPRAIENLILCNAGIDLKITEKALVTFEWWYLASAERGVGTYNGLTKTLSPDLGNELDIYFTYTFNKNVEFGLSAGVFFPGGYYREERDDVDGSLFTPFVRGDGKADPAFQLEASLAFNF